MSDKETTVALKCALRRSFPAGEFALFYEVANGTGGTASNYADAVGMSLWPSRGLQIIGFELKASRSDWLREKAKPKKSVSVQQYCDRWNLVTAKGVVLDASEIPEAWGWMELVGQKLYTRKAAPKLEPIDCTRSFIASMLRRAGQVDEDTISVKVKEAVAVERAQMLADRVRENEKRALETSAAVEAIAAFEASSGILIKSYQAGICGEDFAAFQALRSNVAGWSGLTEAAERLGQARDLVSAAHAGLVALGASTEKESA